MDLKGIISISGLSGLYKVVAQAKNGFIVEALADKRRFPISASQRISALEDISIYADEDIPLKEVFLKIRQSDPDKLPVSSKSDNKALSEYFTSVVPNFDKDRVYPSDIKKVITWYELLKDKIDWDAKGDKTEDAVTENPLEEKLQKPKAVKKKRDVADEKHKEKKESTKKATTAKTRKKV